MTTNTLQQTYGNIDIYLFDQLLKGTYDNCKTVLDVGCGGGRNLIYFLNNGFNVYAIDPNPDAIAELRMLAAELAPKLPSRNFCVAAAEEIPFAPESFDLVICSAVLHFAQTVDHFDAMLRSIWHSVKPGGYFFARLASDIGIEDRVHDLGNSRFLLPDGSERFLVNELTLLRYADELNGDLHEPIKTTNVQNQRCMTTWCMQKRPDNVGYASVNL